MSKENEKTDLFILVDTRYRFDHRKLARRRREATGLNQSQFAYACGWSSSYQWQLENGRVDAVSEATRNVMEDVLNATDKI